MRMTRPLSTRKLHSSADTCGDDFDVASLQRTIAATIDESFGTWQSVISVNWYSILLPDPQLTLEPYTVLVPGEDVRRRPDRVAMSALGLDWCRDGDDFSRRDAPMGIVLSPCGLRLVRDGPRRLSSSSLSPTSLSLSSLLFSPLSESRLKS